MWFDHIPRRHSNIRQNRGLSLFCSNSTLMATLSFVTLNILKVMTEILYFSIDFLFDLGSSDYIIKR